MSAQEIARRHFEAALKDAASEGMDADPIARALLGLIVAKYREYRSIEDVQSELHFVADNCDPDTEFVFMRP